MVLKIIINLPLLLLISLLLLVSLNLVMHQSILAAPSLPPPPPPWADPRADSRGWELLSCQMPRGGDEKRGQMPLPPLSHTKKHATYGPGLRFVSLLHENGIVPDRYENNSCRVSDRHEVRPL